MRLSSLFFAVMLLGGLGSCTKVSGPLQLYFVGSSRFTSGNKTGQQPGDTLATRVFAATSTSSPASLQRLLVRVTYTPNYQPFAYPQPLTAFVFSNLPAGQQYTYLDTLLSAGTKSYLLTSVFGVRTTAGAERWEYEATDTDGNTSSRSFVTTVRRGDSTLTYHNYPLRLNVPARGPSVRRFIQLKPGLAWPTYTVLSTGPNPTAALQGLIDMVQSVDGLSLLSPDALGKTVPDAVWPATRRRATRFRLTALANVDFTSQQDTLAIRQQYVTARGNVQQSLSNLTVGQVYAFRTTPLQNQRPTFGLLRVASVPGGSAAGLQLEVRVAKQAIDVAFTE
jgi:hypothetical protein